MNILIWLSVCVIIYSALVLYLYKNHKKWFDKFDDDNPIPPMC